MLVSFLSIILLFANSFCEGGHSYYISASGNDEATGLSPASAWRTLARLKQTTLVSGDKILLRGGDVFNGSLSIEGKGLEGIMIASYGKGTAVINAGEATGIFISNVPGVRIENIALRGNGVATNKGSGILLYTGAEEKIGHVSIRNCTVKGFRDYGILLQADKSAKSGFKNVLIANCIAEANGEAGIGSLSFYPAISHRNVNILHCKAFNNRGILTKTDNHSGNGIVLSGVREFNIAYCEAYENGADCRSKGGGPVGIWVWNCTNGIIQNSVSHNNHAGTSLHDGGGFDLDGGVSNSIIKNCTSYNNEGAGYLICEFGSGNAFTNNVVEHNTSKNDGLKNSYGGITVAGAGKESPVTNTVVRYNRIHVQAKDVVDGQPSALYFSGGDYKNISVYNNEFSVEDGATAVKTDTLFTEEMAAVKQNLFKTKAAGYSIDCSSCNDAAMMEWKKKLTSANKVE